MRARLLGQRAVQAGILSSVTAFALLSGAGSASAGTVAQAPFDGDPYGCAMPGMPAPQSAACNPYQYGNQNPGTRTGGRGAPVTRAG